MTTAHLEGLRQILFSSIPEAPPMIVKGVYMDFPRNSFLKNSMYTSMHPKESADDWENWS